MGILQKMFRRTSDAAITERNLAAMSWDMSNARSERESLLRAVDALSRDIEYQAIRIKRLERCVKELQVKQS